jgi:hypothetical protein
MNPGVWVSEGDSERGTFTLPADAPVDENTGAIFIANSLSMDSDLKFVSCSFDAILER